MNSCLCSERICHLNIIIEQNKLKSIWVGFKYRMCFDKVSITKVSQYSICAVV